MNFLKGFLLAGLVIFSMAEAKAVPFYPSFHNVNAGVLYSNFSFYPSQGLGMQTLSVYPAPGQTFAAGSFDGHVTGQWYARGGMNTPQFSYWFNLYAQQGFRPRELSAMVNASGQPEFAAIWKKLNGEAFSTYINMSDADFSSKWMDLVGNQGYRIEDYVAYTVGGQRRSAAIFVRDGQAFYLYYGMTIAQFSQRFSQLAALGFYPTSVNAAMTPQGLTYSAVWMQKTGATATYVNMSLADYQAKFDAFGAQGYRLMKVQGYANGTRFAAIWSK